MIAMFMVMLAFAMMAVIRPSRQFAAAKKTTRRTTAKSKISPLH